MTLSQLLSLAALALAPAAYSPGPQAPLNQPALQPSTWSKSIAWGKDLDAALARAKERQRPVLVALNMDGERANTRLATETYRDKEIVALAAEAECLVGSVFLHEERGDCSRFPGLTCQEHMDVEKQVQRVQLARDPNGDVIAPQHVLLAPDGKVLLAVAYSITKEELAWCLTRAVESVDPDAKLAQVDGARPPKRLVMEGVATPKPQGEGGSEASASPATREEALALIERLRKGERGQRAQLLARLMTSDEPEAVEYLQTELRGPMGRRPERLRKLVNQVGQLAPARYWEVVAEYATDSDLEMREEVAAALEQLAAPEASKAIAKALSKEKDGRLRGAWLRALASADPEGRKARSSVVKAAGREKDPLGRAGAIVALGYLAPHKDVTKALTEALREEAPELRLAAACGMALTRDKAWRELLWPILKQEPEGWFTEGLTRCLEVLTQGRLERVAAPLKRVCGDRVDRERFFGRS